MEERPISSQIEAFYRYISNFEEEKTDEMLKAIKQRYLKDESKKDHSLCKDVCIIDLNDDDFPGTYRVCLDRFRKPSKNGKLYQNGKQYDVIRVLTVPIDFDCKKALSEITGKIPKTGKTRYNQAFKKSKLKDVMKAIKTISNVSPAKESLKPQRIAKFSNASSEKAPLSVEKEPNKPNIERIPGVKLDDNTVECNSVKKVIRVVASSRFPYIIPAHGNEL